MNKPTLFIVMIFGLSGLAADKQLSLEQILATALEISPMVKAKVAEIEIALAQMQQLGLIESPQLGFGMLFPIDSPGARIGFDTRLTFNVMDLIQLPARKKLGQAEYDRKKWEIASDILQILTHVKVAYYEYQSLFQLRAFWQANLESVQSMGALSRAQRKAGNISALDEAQQLAFSKMAQLELSKIENELKRARLELAKLTGLASDESSWAISDKLPKLPERVPELETLQKLAQNHRPQLLAQKQKVELNKRNVDLVQLAVLPRLNLGISADWDVERNFGLGPVLQIGLPFLGHQRLSLKKARAELHASELALVAIEQTTPNDLEQVYQRVLLARKMHRFYQSDVLPLQERVMRESIKHYNYMLLGNYQLLFNKQNQIHAQKESIQSLRDYWIAYAELENLIGGPIEEMQ